MFKTASIFLWEYLLEHDLLFKVKLCVPAHDKQFHLSCINCVNCWEILKTHKLQKY